MPKSFHVSLAPQKLWQAINPWSFYQQGAQFGFINIDLGQTNHPDVEQTILDEVGSYGRQLGRIGDAPFSIMSTWESWRHKSATRSTSCAAS